MTARQVLPLAICLAAAGPALCQTLVHITRDQSVMLRKPDGSAVRIASRGSGPALSPDGRQVAFVRSYDDPASGSALCLWTAPAGPLRTLLKAKARIHGLSWSPAGGQLMYVVSEFSGRTRIHLGLPGRSAPEISPAALGASGCYEPVWDPGGKSIFFHDMQNLFQVGSDGKLIQRTPLETITGRRDAVTSADRFVPSPGDPDVIAYTMEAPGSSLFIKRVHEPPSALFLYRIRGRTRTRLTPQTMTAISPTWSRDGRTLLFTGYTDRQAAEPYPMRVYSIAQDAPSPSELCRGEDAAW